MKADVLSLTSSTLLPELTLVIFLATFVGALLWMARPGAREFYRNLALFPLDDDPQPEGPHGPTA